MNNPPIKTALLFLLFSLILLTSPQAATILLPAAPSKYVTDNASVLKGDTAERLSEQLADFDHRTADEVIIMINPNLPKGVSIGDYAGQLYNAWKIGKRGRDTGALLLISTHERQGWIYAGRGLSAKLPESVCRRIFTETIAPHLDAGDYDGAAKAAVSALTAALSR